jgi:outer membrane protein assembly factor BamB
VPPSLENVWPTSLGNERRAGYENELVPDSLVLAWRVNAGSGLHASLLVSDTAVFAGTSNRQLLAFSTRTGRKFWDQRFDGAIPGDIVRSGRTLFITTAEFKGRVHARDMARGRGAWKHDVGASSYGALVEPGALYLGTDRGFVYALQPENGAQIWRIRLHGSLAAVPVNAGTALIIATTTDSLFRIAKTDGQILARTKLERSVSAAPALSGDTLVVADFGGNITALSATSFKVLWRVDTGAPVTAAPVIGADGTVHVLNRDAEIWRISNGHGTRVAALGGAALGSFTLGRNRYVVGKLDGTLQVVDMSGRVVASYKFKDSIPTAVALHNGALYVPFTHGAIAKLVGP